ncbi:hypothetical protein Tco_0477824 [Tanacetum coccineum]
MQPNINIRSQFNDLKEQLSLRKASAKKKGSTVAITTEDMQKRRNDVKARTALLLALPDEHQNRDDLDTMSLDDLYNHLKVYKPEVQKKAGSNSQNMAFISSSNTSSGKGEVPTASVPTTSSQVSTVSTEVAAASLSHDTICAYIATQSSGSQIKYEDITQIDEDDIEEMDIKWNLVLLSMRANRVNLGVVAKFTWSRDQVYLEWSQGLLLSVQETRRKDVKARTALLLALPENTVKIQQIGLMPKKTLGSHFENFLEEMKPPKKTKKNHKVKKCNKRLKGQKHLSKPYSCRQL